MKLLNRILAIDYGMARIGLAITDPLNITAQSLDTVEIRNLQDAIIKIESIIKEKSVKKIVIGYPRHMDGRISEMTGQIDKLIQHFEQGGITVIKWDERLTTVMAYKTMKELGIKQTEKKKHADRLAALYLLQDFLSSQI